MPEPDKVLRVLGETRIVAIMRGDLQGRSLEAIHIMLEAGIRAVEITMNSAGVLTTIQDACKEFEDRLIIGAGTVTTAEQVAQVQGAGAQFVVSPNTNPRVIAETCKRGLASFPGAFTCTEVMQAFDAGAHAVKLFPMVDMSPAYVKALRAPLGDVPLIPTGGIHAGNAASYLEHGAFALGIGSELVNGKTVTPGGMNVLSAAARALVNAVKEYRTER